MLWQCQIRKFDILIILMIIRDNDNINDNKGIRNPR